MERNQNKKIVVSMNGYNILSDSISMLFIPKRV